MAEEVDKIKAGIKDLQSTLKPLQDARSRLGNESRADKNSKSKYKKLKKAQNECEYFICN